MATVKDGILLASIKSDLVTSITVGSSDSDNLVLTEGCRRISVYNVRIFGCIPCGRFSGSERRQAETATVESATPKR